MSRFDNQSVIVTGAGSGFGEAIAKRFAAEGARVVVPDINQDSGARVASEITADGGAALFIPADVSSEADVQALMEGTCEDHERIDVLVNNAGYSHRQNLTWRITVEEFDAVFAVNVRGVFLGVKYAVPVMIDQGGGAIVNIASIGAIAPRPGVTPCVRRWWCSTTTAVESSLFFPSRSSGISVKTHRCQKSVSDIHHFANHLY